jgi:hypothetical protein
MVQPKCGCGGVMKLIAPGISRCQKCKAWDIDEEIVGKDSFAKDHLASDPKVKELANRLMKELHLGEKQAESLARQLLSNERAAGATDDGTDEHDASASVRQKPRPQGRQFADRGDLSGYRPAVKAGSLPVNPLRGEGAVRRWLGEQRVAALEAEIRKDEIGAMTEHEKLRATLKLCRSGIWDVAKHAAAQAFPEMDPDVAIGKWIQTPGGKALYELLDRIGGD